MNKEEWNHLKQNYAKLIKKSFDENISILIESYIEYYGEEYRKLITEKISKLNFAFYIPLIKLDEKCDREWISKNKNEYKILEICRETELTNIESLIYATNETILKDKKVKKYLNYIISERDPFYINSLSDSKLKHWIVFPMDASDVSFIHEVNHAINDNLLLLVNRGEFQEKVSKIGLETDSNETILDELINDKISIDIAKIFREKGGNLKIFCFDAPAICYYRENFYLINEFYETFKSLIKIAVISENKNLLVQTIGPENYYSFVKLVLKSYGEKEKPIKEKVLVKIRYLIGSMKEYINFYGEPIVNNDEKVSPYER